MEEEVFIAAGSNIEPHAHLPAALARLAAEVEVAAVSTFYRTAALGPPGRPDFRNGAFRVRTALSPRALKFEVLRRIEADLGRCRGADRYAPRTIDLDIALFGRQVISEEDLQLPDPDVRRRPFVAVPLLELAPDLMLPDTGERLDGLPVARDRAGLEADFELTRVLKERISK